MIRAQQGKPPLTLDVLNRYRSSVLVMTLEEVRAEFNTLNALTGFDRKTSPATDAQRAVIARLERVVHGTRKTGFKDAMTYAGASLYIEDLRALRESKVA